MSANSPKNVLGEPLCLCCNSPKTGFYRDGFCKTGSQDVGLHLICAEVTHEFLEYSRSCGNDLVTPMPLYQFPGLKPGDRWCLCVSRWREALDAGVAPPIDLQATHESTLKYISIDVLKQYAIQS